jgi:hypothetical protein
MVLNKETFFIGLFLIFLVLCAGCISDKALEIQERELSFTLVPEQTRITEGKPFNIELVLTNTGNTSVNVWELMEQISYDIFFVDSNGSYVPYECGMIERVMLTDEALVELQPGESLKINQDSSYWTLPFGTYTLYATYHTSGGEGITKPYWIGQVSSDNVTIVVEAENKSSLLESVSPLGDSAVEESNTSDAPITIGVSCLVEYMSPEVLTKKSDLILTGSIKEILAARWNTPDGKSPDKNFNELDGEDVIYRDIVVSVDNYLKNSLSSEEVIVRILGGTVGNLTMDVEDMPSFEPGEKVLLFLDEDTDPATKNLDPEHFVVCGSFQGKFSITEDGKAINKGEIVELEELLKLINASS